MGFTKSEYEQDGSINVKTIFLDDFSPAHEHTSREKLTTNANSKIKWNENNNNKFLLWFW